MNRFYDKLLLFAACNFMFFYQNDGVTPTALFLFLASASLSCFQYYFSGTRFLVACGIFTIGFSFLCPAAIFFLPLLAYDAAYHVLYQLFILYFFPVIYTFLTKTAISNAMLLALLPALLLSLLLACKSYRLSAQEKDLKRLRDDSMELKLLSEKHQRELIEQHETELHIATLQERNRIAREIHDNVGHMLSRSLLQVGALRAMNQNDALTPHFTALKETLDTAMNNIRESVHDLKDESLDLYEMISSILSSYPDYTIHFDYDVNETIPRDLKYCFLSIIKEALSNTLKHSNATKINLILREHPANFQLLIEDNGTGCAKEVKSSDGIGLLNMKERIAAFGGNITITNSNGFRIFISVPRTHG